MISGQQYSLQYDDVPVYIGSAETKVPWGSVQAIYFMNSNAAAQFLMRDGAVKEYKLKPAKSIGTLDSGGEITINCDGGLISVINLSLSPNKDIRQMMQNLGDRSLRVHSDLFRGGVAKFIDGTERRFQTAGDVVLVKSEGSSKRFSPYSVLAASFETRAGERIAVITTTDEVSHELPFRSLRFQVKWDEQESTLLTEENCSGVTFSGILVPE